MLARPAPGISKSEEKMIHSANFVSDGRGLAARRDFHAPGADQTARTPRRRDRLSAASPAGLLPLPALACMAALALGLTATTAGAQDTILVTNNAQTTHTTYASVGVVAGFQYSGAQSFTTGAHANGYSLDSVRINSLGSNDRPVVTVSIHSNNSGVPGSELLQLIGGNSGVTSGLNNFPCTRGDPPGGQHDVLRCRAGKRSEFNVPNHIRRC